ncbi:unnamed protein product [Rhodiola kirilowii]
MLSFRFSLNRQTHLSSNSSRGSHPLANSRIPHLTQKHDGSSLTAPSFHQMLLAAQLEDDASSMNLSLGKTKPLSIDNSRSHNRTNTKAQLASSLSSSPPSQSTLAALPIYGFNATEAAASSASVNPDAPVKTHLRRHHLPSSWASYSSISAEPNSHGVKPSAC